MATGVGTVPVPDLKLKTEQQALQAISDAGLRVGVRSEAFDPLVPVGLVVVAEPVGRDRRGQADAGRLRHLEGPGADPVADADAHADPDADAHADADPDTDAHADADPDTDAHADAHADADPAGGITLQVAPGRTAASPRSDLHGSAGRRPADLRSAPDPRPWQPAARAICGGVPPWNVRRGGRRSGAGGGSRRRRSRAGR